MQRFDVTWWGKTATFLLMFAVPGFLMAESSIGIAGGFEVAAWCFAIPGLVLSYYTAVDVYSGDPRRHPVRWPSVNHACLASPPKAIRLQP